MPQWEGELTLNLEYDPLQWHLHDILCEYDAPAKVTLSREQFKDSHHVGVDRLMGFEIEWTD